MNQYCFTIPSSFSSAVLLLGWVSAMLCGQTAATGAPQADRGAIFPPETVITKLADGFAFTEGPALGPDGKIYFNDIPNETTHVFDPKTQVTERFREQTGKANGLFWTADGALISCEGGNRRVTWRRDGTERVLADSFEGKRLNSPNDLVLDDFGGCYFTDPRYGSRDDMEMEVEGVYYLSADQELRRIDDQLQRPNGIILSPDQKTLYVADQAAGAIWAYSVVGEGIVENRRRFASFGSDGMSVDRDGNIFLTWDGAIIVLSPEGTEIDRLELPESPANCLLAGNTLYITARTGFYAVETTAQGID